MVIVEVQGGVLQAVYSDRPTKIVLVDWDTEGCQPGEPNLVTVQDAAGTEHLVWAVEFPPAPLGKMPAETQEAALKSS